MQGSILIFQHTGHLLPLAFVVSTIILVSKFSVIEALEVMHNSEKSVFFEISRYSLFNFIIIFASKLDPISLEDLFSSILILLTSLI